MYIIYFVQTIHAVCHLFSINHLDLWPNIEMAKHGKKKKKLLVNIITATLFAESDVSFVSGCQYMYIWIIMLTMWWLVHHWKSLIHSCWINRLSPVTLLQTCCIYLVYSVSVSASQLFVVIWQSHWCWSKLNQSCLFRFCVLSSLF